MAAVEQNLVNSDDQFKNCDSPTQSSEIDSKSSDSKSEFQKNINELTDILSNLNPWAKEFIPSSYRLKNDQSVQTDFSAPTKNVGDDKFPNNRRRKINFNQGKRRMNGRAFRPQREESVRRTES